MTNAAIANFLLNVAQVNSESVVNGGTQQEYILDDDECPLAILMNHPSTRGKSPFSWNVFLDEYHSRRIYLLWFIGSLFE